MYTPVPVDDFMLVETPQGQFATIRAAHIVAMETIQGVPTRANLFLVSGLVLECIYPAVVETRWRGLVRRFHVTVPTPAKTARRAVRAEGVR